MSSPPLPPPPRPARARRAPDELVEREREIAELGACLGDALGEQGRLVLVSGPAGIGKSRLLAEARRLVEEAGALLLTARCSELEREFGFGAVRQLFEPLLADPAARDRLLRGSAAAAGPVFDVAAAPAPGGPEESSFATLHGLYWLTVNLTAERAVVLAVDDLHWCDGASLRFLTYLVRRLDGLPVLVLATQRTGEAFPDEALLEELSQDVATVTVQPGPLSEAGLRRVVAAGLGAEPDPAFAAACLDTTAGNPLLLRQLLRALEGEGVRPDGAHADTARALGSRAISSMVLLRLRRLPREATAVARALAVLGDRSALPLVAALAGLDEATAAAATADLARVEVLRGESPLAFVHGLVRSAVLSDLPPGERDLLHDRAARLLAGAGGSAEQVAAQLLAAPNRADAWAVAQLREAAAAAMRRGAPDAARTFLGRALQEPPPPAERVDVLLELARAEVSLDGPSALAHLEEGYALLSDPARRAGVAVALARTLIFAAERGRGPAFARQARAELPDACEDDRQGLLALERIAVHMHGLDADEWGLVAAGHPPPEIGTGPGANMLAAQLAWEQMCLIAPREQVVATARRALEDGSLYVVDNGLLWVVAIMVMDLADVDVLPLWDDALALAHRRGSLFAVLSVSLWRGVSLLRRGDLPEAEESLRASIDQLGMWRAGGTGLAYADAMLVENLVEQDRLVEAAEHLRRTSLWIAESDGHRLMLEAEATLLLAQQRWAAAVPLLERALRMVPHMRNPAWRVGPSLLADAYAGMGRLADARRILDRELDAARRWGGPSTLGPILRRSGALRARRAGCDGGDGGEGADGAVAADGAALAELEEAEALLAGTAFRLEHGWSLFELARLLLPVPHERARAVGLLLRALEVAESSSAGRLRRIVVAALADVGVEIPATRTVGPAALTSTQRRIAVLAADGVPVRRIAEALYLTPRGVEQHLDEVRRRLGVDARGDLAAALADVSPNGHGISGAVARGVTGAGRDPAAHL